MNDNTESTTKGITFEGQNYIVPTWVGWAARDEDGEVWGYADEPQRNTVGWSCMSYIKDAYHMKVFTKRWENSLVKV